MRKRLSSDQVLELKKLRDRALLFLDFLIKVGAEDAESLTGFVESVHRTFEKQDLPGMRMIRTDLDSWLRDLPTEAQSVFGAMLTQTTGDDLRRERESELTQIESIVARGTITSDAEYSMLERRAEEIYDDPAREDELKRINTLLTAYYLESRK